MIVRDCGADLEKTSSGQSIKNMDYLLIELDSAILPASRKRDDDAS